MEKYQVIILAAGKGTRMGDASIPKVLVALKDKPLLAYVLKTVGSLKIESKPIVVVGYMQDKVRDVFGDECVYAVQEKQLGTAHAVMSAKDMVYAENVLVLYGDMPFVSSTSLEALCEAHEKQGGRVSMLTTVAPNFDGVYTSLLNYGRIVRSENGEIAKIVEYKDCSESEKIITEVNPGIYMFSAEWLWKSLELIENHNAQNEYYLTDLVDIAVSRGEKIASAFLPPLEALGVNSPRDLEIALSI